MCYVQSLGLDFNPTMKEFLFGDLSVPFDHTKNFLSLLIKRFIWQNKFRNINLSLNGLKNAWKVALNELKIIYELKENKCGSGHRKLPVCVVKIPVSNSYLFLDSSSFSSFSSFSSSSSSSSYSSSSYLSMYII